MYVCKACVDEHKLKIRFMGCGTTCEICGMLRNDWSTKFVVWTSELSRLKPNGDWSDRGDLLLQLRERSIPSERLPEMVH